MKEKEFEEKCRVKRECGVWIEICGK